MNERLRSKLPSILVISVATVALVILLLAFPGRVDVAAAQNQQCDSLLKDLIHRPDQDRSHGKLQIALQCIRDNLQVSAQVDSHTNIGSSASRIVVASYDVATAFGPGCRIFYANGSTNLYNQIINGPSYVGFPLLVSYYQGYLVSESHDSFYVVAGFTVGPYLLELTLDPFQPVHAERGSISNCGYTQ